MHGSELHTILDDTTHPTKGPMPMTDGVGMGVAVNLLFNSLAARHRLKGATHI